MLYIIKYKLYICNTHKNYRSRESKVSEKKSYYENGPTFWSQFSPIDFVLWFNLGQSYSKIMHNEEIQD